jgi:hypothetical protein
LATAALVCGVVAMLGCLPVSLVGIVLGIVALVRTKGNPQRYGGKGLAIGGIATGVAGLIIYPLGAFMLWPAFMRGMETGMRQVCAANMQQIGHALYAYAQQDGMFPEKDADWTARLLNAGYIKQEQLLCPSQMAMSGTSYFYVPGYGIHSKPTQIILYEYPDAHGGEGGHVLYQDAHVTWLPSPQFEEAIDSITLPDGTPYTPHKVMWAEDEEEEEGDG